MANATLMMNANVGSRNGINSSSNNGITSDSSSGNNDGNSTGNNTGNSNESSSNSGNVGSEIGTMVQYRCNAGFSVDGEEAIAVCTTNGSWKYAQFTCKGNNIMPLEILFSYFVIDYTCRFKTVIILSA